MVRRREKNKQFWFYFWKSCWNYTKTSYHVTFFSERRESTHYFINLDVIGNIVIFMSLLVPAFYSRS